MSVLVAFGVGVLGGYVRDKGKHWISRGRHFLGKAPKGQSAGVKVRFKQCPGACRKKGGCEDCVGSSEWNRKIEEQALIDDPDTLNLICVFCYEKHEPEAAPVLVAPGVLGICGVCGVGALVSLATPVGMRFRERRES